MCFIRGLSGLSFCPTWKDVPWNQTPDHSMAKRRKEEIYLKNGKNYKKFRKEIEWHLSIPEIILYLHLSTFFLFHSSMYTNKSLTSVGTEVLSVMLPIDPQHLAWLLEHISWLINVCWVSKWNLMRSLVVKRYQNYVNRSDFFGLILKCSLLPYWSVSFLIGTLCEELINWRQDLSVSGSSGQTDAIFITLTDTLSIN